MDWLNLPYSELETLNRERTVVLLPMGAIEAHGPHLPLGTDGWIAEAMARRAAEKLPAFGLQGLILPVYHWTVAEFARGFVGTLNFSLESVQSWLSNLLQGLQAQGWKTLAIANAHLDPQHLACLRQGLQDTPLAVAFPDLTRGRLARRLSEEFQSGACHAGQYEGSLVLATQPQLVRTEVAQGLAPNPHSLVVAIQQGKGSFEEAGGPQAYFGNPAGARAEEGQASLEVLAEILVEAILQVRGTGGSC